MTVLIIAASKSDVEIMSRAAAKLKQGGIKAEMRVCSAHRTPDLLDSILVNKEYDAIIAGAGLAAALPGVVAAKTTVPVIGVPLSGAFEGLDAMLSVIQMPPGIPVITTGINNAEEAAGAAAKIVRNTAKKVCVINLHNKNSKAIDKATDALKQFGIPHENSNTEKKDAINLAFIDINEKPPTPSKENITIYCPTAEKENANDAVKLLQLAKGGIWVGLNRGENAAVAAAEILKMKTKLDEYRWDMRRKVEEADKEASNQ